MRIFIQPCRKKASYLLLLFLLFSFSQLSYAECIGPADDCDGIIDIIDC